MAEAERVRPQGERTVPIPAAVFHIPDERQGARGKLHADLVGAPGVQNDAQQGKLRERFKHGVFKLRVLDAAALALHNEGFVLCTIPEEQVA